MKLTIIPPEQLEVGMSVAVLIPFKYGWNAYTGLTKYDIFNISRITPKKTKVFCDETEYLTRNTTFYVPTPEMDMENRRVKEFISILQSKTTLEQCSAKRFIDTLENMEKTAELFKRVLVRAKEEKNDE